MIQRAINLNEIRARVKTLKRLCRPILLVSGAILEFPHILVVCIWQHMDLGDWAIRVWQIEVWDLIECSKLCYYLLR